MDGLSPDLVAEFESTRTTDRTSTRTARVEILTRAEPRRSWTAEQMRQIVAESLGPDQTATKVARKYRISSGQLYTWRQQLPAGLRGHARSDVVCRGWTSDGSVACFASSAAVTIVDPD